MKWKLIKISTCTLYQTLANLSTALMKRTHRPCHRVKSKNPSSWLRNSLECPPQSRSTLRGDGLCRLVSGTMLIRKRSQFMRGTGEGELPSRMLTYKLKRLLTSILNRMLKRVWRTIWLRLIMLKSLIGLKMKNLTLYLWYVKKVLRRQIRLRWGYI